ncbi:MAG: methionine--tRNA ligase [Actinomycetes bacterium]
MDAYPTSVEGSAHAKAFYVTTPIYYVNDAPHIGHAYTTIAGDVLTRWHRQRGEAVWYLTGTDEHGQKVLRSAQAHGMSPQAWVDQLVTSSWRPVLDRLEIANDDFIRTTETRHTQRVADFWQRIYDSGDVYQGSYSGIYCVACEEFKLPGDLVEGTGEYVGVQVCAIHGRPVETVAEENWFFRMSAYTERLLAAYDANPDMIAPASARNEVVSFVRQGLADLSISRSTFDWGIPIPWDTGHVLYVWIDALLNYVTAVGYGTDPERFAATWPADVHLVGKDILRFHAVIWPAMLMAAGLPLPRKVFAHGWLLVAGEKMSKTALTGISPDQAVDHVGPDALRYYLMRAIQFGQDGSFSWEHLSAVYSAELANGLGNLVARVTAMVGRYAQGRLPAPTGDRADPSGPAEQTIARAMAAATEQADAAVEQLRLHDALEAIWELVRAVNGYLTEQEPWALAKDPEARGRLDTVLYTAADALRCLAVLLAPVTPQASGTLWSAIGGLAGLGPLDTQRVGQAGQAGLLPPGVEVTKPEALFPRLDDPAETVEPRAR